jgi:Carboxypeptidase regulatory-like domain/TonB dependent receptor
MSAARLALALLAIMAGNAAVRAQTPGGTIAGTVTGDDGNHLVGLSVTVESETTGVRRTATTDENGHYEIAGLPVGSDYTVRVALAGFATVANERVALAPSGPTTVDFIIRLTLRETIAVAGSPILDENQSVVQQTVSDRLVHSLPLLGRNFIPLASLAAGFSGNPNYPSPQGQMYWTNNVLVDGASHFSKWRSAPRTFYSGYSLESIKEIRVLTNRFSAEYGEVLGTVTSAITKTGQNEYHGSGLFYFQNGALNEPPEFAEENPPSSAQRFGFSLGGPLTTNKDRTHFLESYEGRRSRTSNIVVSPAADGAIAPDNEDEHLFFFRVDHRASANHYITSRYNGQFFRWHNERGGLDLPGTGTYFKNDVHTWLTSDRHEVGGRWLNEARFQFARFVDERSDLQPTVFVSRSGYSQQGGTIGPYGFGAEPEDTWEAADTLSYLSTIHALKFGGGLKHVRAHNPYLNYGRGAYFFGGDPAAYPTPYLFMQGIAPTAESAFADPRSLAAFGFVQDDWRVHRTLTLNLGVRYDVDSIDNVRNYSAATDTNNFQPRLGAAWRPFDRTVIRGGAGLYTQQHLLFYINKVQLEGPDGTVNLSLAPESPVFPTFPSVLSAFPPGVPYPPRDIQQLSQAFRNPYSVQATIGIERAVRRITLTADYVYLAGHDLMSLVDANAPASIQKPAQRSVAEADATRPIRPLPGLFRNIVTLGNQGRSWYHALQVKADRSSGRLQAMASYTLSHGEDMLNYQLPEDSRNLDAERARANADVRHNLTVGFTWSLPGTRPVLRDWNLSGIGVFRSNRPYTITWGDDRNGTTQNDARPDGRNTAATDAYQNLDLALSRRFPFGSRSFEARVETFNLFNVTNYDEYVGALLSPFYAQPVSAFPKRRVQLAATVRF